MQKLSSLDLVEALQLAQAVARLHDRGLLTSLSQPRTAEELAKKHRVDVVILRGTLDYIAARTNLVRKQGDRFVATRHYDAASKFLLDVYALAYGGPGVDRRRLARAFKSASPSGALPAIIRQLGFNHVLDLGCGSGSLLVALARDDPHFVGWGIELDPAMCKVARANVRTARVAGRVKIFRGDAMRPKIRAGVQAVVASQLANEMFGSGTARVIAWLRRVRRAFPDRPLLIADYYGRLGTGRRTGRETLLHDFIQLISGQGVPPADRKEWQRLYDAAGCRLVHVIEDTHTTLFVHLVVLSAA